MTGSLRTRLWLSYALLVGILLVVVAVSLGFALLRNPTVYRSVLPQLRGVERRVLPGVRDAIRGNAADLQSFLESVDTGSEDFRLAVIDPNGRVIADNMRARAGAFPRFEPDSYPHLLGANRPGLVRDLRRRFWVFWTAEIGQGDVLLIAMRLPQLPLAQLLRNEVAAPLIYSGGIAILAASLLSLAMGTWIAAPLRRMASASRAMAAGKEVVLPVEGPTEIRDLAITLNEMHRQTQESLQKQRDVLQSQRDFVANVSHELKTPLTSIQGFSQAILDGTAQTPEMLRSAAEVIYNESQRMSRLVMDLLTLARLEAGTADLQREYLDLAALLRSVAHKFTPQAAAGRVEMVTLIPDLPAIAGDGDRLAQVFTNLVDNAMKFTPPEGRVGIRAQAVDGGLLVDVWDTGQGIPAAERERVFERFYQVEKSRSGSGGGRGVGLGLPIARQIVLAHGGRIWAEGNPDGTSGSCFRVWLPVG